MTERLANRIAGLAGTPWFAIGHIAWFAISFPGYRRSTRTLQLPHLAVSLEAIFLTLFVLISQNRLTR